MSELQIAHLSVNGKELQDLYNILDEMPGKIGRPLFQKFQAQVAEQIVAHEKAEREAAERARIAERNRIVEELTADLRPNTSNVTPIESGRT